jgi:hypothetical protein
MEKQNVISLMINSMNEDNKALCEQAGMSKEEAEQNITQSQPSLLMMMSNIYDKLKKENVIA